MTVERGARKEERCGDVLNTLVRCDQGLQNIALALRKLKGSGEGIEALIERELRHLCGDGLALGGYGIRAKVASSKRQVAAHFNVIDLMPRLSQQRDRNTHKQHKSGTQRQQHVLARDNRHRRCRHEHRANVIDDAAHARPQIRPMRINRNGGKLRREKHHEEARAQIEDDGGGKRVAAVGIGDKHKE